MPWPAPAQARQADGAASLIRAIHLRCEARETHNRWNHPGAKERGREIAGILCESQGVLRV